MGWKLTIIVTALVLLASCARLTDARIAAVDSAIKMTNPPPKYLPFKETFVVRFLWYAGPGH